jgi:hypothetical protein
MSVELKVQQLAKVCLLAAYLVFFGEISEQINFFVYSLLFVCSAGLHYWEILLNY